MKLKGTQVISNLKAGLQMEIGRHLYAVVGSYEQLSAFEKNDLSLARKENGTVMPIPVNLSRALLERIGDSDLRELVKQEGKLPKGVKRKLGLEFDSLLANLLNQDHLVILKNLELLFAFELELETVRARANNQNHILMMLPGEKRGDHVVLFSEAEQRFHRQLPLQLIADNHLWELDNA
ncbi:MAG: hypothetical protein WCK35_21950 [Chloroflexota bacterium]